MQMLVHDLAFLRCRYLDRRKQKLPRDGPFRRDGRGRTPPQATLQQSRLSTEGACSSQFLDSVADHPSISKAQACQSSNVIPHTRGPAVGHIGVAANAGTLVVNKTEDDGSKHTLRWAILENNANGGGNRIQISPTGNPHKDWVIQVNSLLPAIKGPAVIEGKSRGTTTAPK